MTECPVLFLPGQSAAGPVELLVNSGGSWPVRPFWGSQFVTPWRCSFDDALRPVDLPISNSGPYMIHQGAIAATCTHEAGHCVALVSTGRRVGGVEVALDFVRSYDGGVAASVRGQAAPLAALKVVPSTSDAPSIPLLDVEPQSCWLASWKRALFMCAGPAAEMRYRSQAGLSRGFIGGSDSESLDRVSRFVWLMAGRDGAAFTRLAWREACRLMDVPLIWAAVQAVEAELFSGLLRLEPADPRPGDSVKFVMPGAQAEAAASPAFIEFTGERKRRPRRDIAQARRPI